MRSETSTRASLLDHLRALTREGGDHNHLILGSEGGYLLFVGARGEDVVECEVSVRGTSPSAALARRGFTSQRGRRNPARRLEGFQDEAPARLEGIADEALEIAAELLGAAPGSLILERRLGDRPKARSPELVRAMKVLAMTREMPARQRVYHEVMRSTLLLALAGDDGDGDGDEPHVFEHLQGFPVIGVFTDWDALRLWEPRGWPVRELPGHVILPMARARKVGSLLINPKGDVGGELLMNEIAALAEASWRYAG